MEELRSPEVNEVLKGAQGPEIEIMTSVWTTCFAVTPRAIMFAVVNELCVTHGGNQISYTIMSHAKNLL
jgi:hypothetical protein